MKESKFTPEFLDTLAQKLSAVLPDSLHTAKADLEKNFKAVLSAVFEKMDLVTREEFDAQVQVLHRTRARLDALIEKLESSKGNAATAHDPANPE